MLKKRLAAFVTLGCLFGIPALPADLPLPVHQAAAEAAQEVSTPEAFTQALYENLNARNTSFSIIYDGSYESVYNGDFDAMMQKAFDLHQSGSSDDFDYLQYNIATYQFNVPSISDRSEFQFNITYREPLDWLQQVNQDVASILPSLRGNTDYDTIRNVHDYVVNRITYDNSLTRYTAYQGIVEQSTVCQGYALLTYKLLTDLGIPCRYIRGYAGESHAWNIVKLGSQWYFLDTTWDDPVSSEPILRYDYFLVGSDRFCRDHTLDKKFQTPEFINAYPISQTDYVPGESESNTAVVTQQTDEQKAREIKEREELYTQIREAIVSSVDSEKAGPHASPMEVQVSDLTKHILLGMFARQSNENLLKLAGNSDLLNKVMNNAEEKVTQRLIKPLDAYSDTDRYLQICSKRRQEVLDKTDTAHMSPEIAAKFEADLQQRVVEQTLMEELERISAAETEKLIDEIAQDMNAILN